MTCFWDGILQALDKKDFELVSSNTKMNKEQFIRLLKSKNTETKEVCWNGSKLSEQELKEHFETIKNYDISKINQGHLCSSCDSFLLLICEVFDVKIKHIFLNVNIEYKKDKVQRKTLNFASNGGHFWKI